MAGKNDPGVKSTEPEFLITRLFDAPRELVFKAWTEPRHVSQWWGPRSFTASTCEMDVRVGGTYRITMRSADGVEYPIKGIFQEIVRPERIVMTQDTSGHPREWRDQVLVNSDHQKGDNDAALIWLTTVTFEDEGGKTKLTVGTLFESAAIRDAVLKMGITEGWSQTLDRLAEELAAGLTTKAKPFVIERTVNAPIAIVWKAISEQDAIVQWFFEFREFKPEVGAKFHFTAEDKGFTYIHHCVVREVIANKRLAYSWRYEGYEGDSLVTFELFAEGNKTRVKLTHEGLENFPKLPAFARSNFEKGWTMLIGSSLKNYVEGVGSTADREISATRIFDAPRDLVFSMWTDPKHIAQWWGPKGFTNTIHEMNVKAGGVWQFIMHGPNGVDYPNKIVYTEVVKPERLAYDHMSSPNFHATVTFEEQGGKTKLTMRMLFDTAEVRDKTVKAFNAVEGQRQTLGRLADYLVGR